MEVCVRVLDGGGGGAGGRGGGAGEGEGERMGVGCTARQTWGNRGRVPASPSMTKLLFDRC